MDLSESALVTLTKIDIEELKLHLETTSSTYIVNSYVSLGLARLVAVLGLHPDDFYHLHDNPATNIIYEIGVLYTETWRHIQEIRSEAKRVKREVKKISHWSDSTFWDSYLCRKNAPKKAGMFQRAKFLARNISSLDLITSLFKYMKERQRAENLFIQNMVDTFEGTFRMRKNKTSKFDKKLWRLYDKFRRTLPLVTDEQLLLPGLLGQLRRDIARNIGLPDLTACHMKLKEASAKLKRAETKWLLRRLQILKYYYDNSKVARDAIYAIIFGMFIGIFFSL